MTINGKKGTNFKNGLSNAPSGSIFDGLNTGSVESDYIIWHDDFSSYDANQWQLTKTEAGSASGSVELADKKGGELVLTTDNAAGDITKLAWKGAAAGSNPVNPFKFSRDKYFHMQARFKISGTGVNFLNTHVGLGLMDGSKVAALPGVSNTWSLNNAAWFIENSPFYNSIFGGDYLFYMVSETGAGIRPVGPDSQTPISLAVDRYINIGLSSRYPQRAASNRLPGPSRGAGGVIWNQSYAGTFKGTDGAIRGPLINCYMVDEVGDVGPAKKWVNCLNDANSDGSLPASQEPVTPMTPFIAIGNRSNTGNQCKLTVDSLTIIQER